MSEPIGKIGTGRNVGLPVTTFLYTLDQIASMVQLAKSDLQHKYLYFVGRTPGRKLRHQIPVCNIAQEDERPDWRVAEQDFVRWLRTMGFDVRTQAWM